MGFFLHLPYGALAWKFLEHVMCGFVSSLYAFLIDLSGFRSDLDVYQLSLGSGICLFCFLIC